jgi:peptidyl-tRNA hydrolase
LGIKTRNKKLETRDNTEIRNSNNERKIVIQVQNVSNLLFLYSNFGFNKVIL